MPGRENKMSVALACLVCSYMSKPSAIVERSNNSKSIHHVWTEVKERWGGRKVILKVLSGSVPYCKRDHSNFEVGERNIPKSTALVIYKHNRDRELLAGAGAEGRSKATSDLSVHTHKLAEAHTHILPLQGLLRNTLTNRHRHTYPQRHIHFSSINVCFHIHAHTQTTENRVVGFVVKIS